MFYQLVEMNQEDAKIFDAMDKGSCSFQCVALMRGNTYAYLLGASTRAAIRVLVKNLVAAKIISRLHLNAIPFESHFMTNVPYLNDSRYMRLVYLSQLYGVTVILVENHINLYAIDDASVFALVSQLENENL